MTVSVTFPARYIRDVAERTASRPAALRSTAQLPLRAITVPDGASTRTGRLPLQDPRPQAPGGFAAKAFAGEAVPFRVVAFREGHDRIGVHLRLVAPDGEETLHRMLPLQDGTDRWRVDVPLEATGL